MGPLLFGRALDHLLKTIIYVDGFNLYYGCLKGTSYKWLDLKVLFEKILDPHYQITAINYFTTRVKPYKGDGSALLRQQAYIKAIETYIPEIKVRYGDFLEHKVSMINANPPPNRVQVIKTEEKGSDVNLAVHLLNDAWLNKFDCGVVVSNDSDMAESMRLVRQYHPDKTLGLIKPRKQAAKSLEKHAHFIRNIRKDALRTSQLPESIPDTSITKPIIWR